MLRYRGLPSAARMVSLQVLVCEKGTKNPRTLPEVILQVTGTVGGITYSRCFLTVPRGYVGDVPVAAEASKAQHERWGALRAGGTNTPLTPEGRRERERERAVVFDRTRGRESHGEYACGRSRSRKSNSSFPHSREAASSD